MSPSAWYVYLLACGDGSLYTGITTDVRRRLAAHRRGRGARYTRGRGPLVLVWVSPPLRHAEAARQEAIIKRWPRAAKLRLVAEGGDGYGQDTGDRGGGPAGG
ncbi:GIY-YIG domain-containing protein [Candidatus Hydrogenisulfobacillus filiaventi]|uniref:GIY-YIG domain-containing protein n=1 Tax=Candidatus Hydrogenisulfobacillus filiaventi TaxID=2707344 RepID=A0A6F8ZJL4_9FIRM|nr:GIY-YIG domain-containing protein [Candidatus Hydrogenisulfobacillus filiaventi]